MPKVCGSNLTTTSHDAPGSSTSHVVRSIAKSVSLVSTKRGTTGARPILVTAIAVAPSAAARSITVSGNTTVVAANDSDAGTGTPLSVVGGAGSPQPAAKQTSANVPAADFMRRAYRDRGAALRAS